MIRNDGERAFLEVPWEILAQEKNKAPVFLAEDDRIQFCPVRRLGEKNSQAVPAPSPYRLSAVFMAASPHQAGLLDFEAEEIAILDATGRKGIDLTVEESGNLGLLAQCLADCTGGEDRVDVLHISCHGTNKDGPLLVMENKKGGRVDVGPGAFAGALGKKPGLLFLSACLTSGPDALFTTFSSAMAERGFPAVLGWAGSVGDREATLFSSHLYTALSRGMTIEDAVARARFKLLRPDHPEETPCRNWHLARLYLRPDGGGILSSGQNKRQVRGVEYGHKEFLDKKKGRVPVAGRREFVGRRRQIQKILSIFGNNACKSVLIHGFGNLGKSSLAARIANRMPGHQVVVVFEHYDRESILQAFRQAYRNEEINRILDPETDRGTDFPTTLRQILEGPCADLAHSGDKQYARRPALLVIDDFERLLDPPAKDGGLHRVNSDYTETVAWILEAFNSADTDSRLLITSRYAFSLNMDGQSIPDHLTPVPLPSMNETESRKQLAAKLCLEAGTKIDPDQLKRCLGVSRGNPGLARVLIQMSLKTPEVCKKVIEEMAAYIREGIDPKEKTVQHFLGNLMIDRLIGFLTRGEQYVLQACTGFRVPLPVKVLENLARHVGIKNEVHPLQRLTGFGLLETLGDVVFPATPALALNKLAGTRVNHLSEKDTTVVAEQICPDLFNAWGGKNHKNRPDMADLQLSVLALPIENKLILEHCLEGALNELNRRSDFRIGAWLAIQGISLLESKNIEQPSGLLNAAFELCQGAGETDHAQRYIEKSLDGFHARADEADPQRSYVYASALLRHGRFLVQKGKIEQAVNAFEQAETYFDKSENLRDLAIVKGDIARIMVDKGDVDQAMKLHKERIEVFDSLGDRRSKAVTLGDIARIMVSKGDVDQAMKLHKERSEIFTLLDNKDGMANTLYGMGEIAFQQGDTEAACENFKKSYKLYLELGKLDGISVVGMYLGSILCGEENKEQGAKILQRSYDGFKKLGWDGPMNQVAKLIKSNSG